MGLGAPSRVIGNTTHNDPQYWYEMVTERGGAEPYSCSWVKGVSWWSWERRHGPTGTVTLRGETRVRGNDQATDNPTSYSFTDILLISRHLTRFPISYSFLDTSSLGGGFLAPERVGAEPY